MLDEKVSAEDLPQVAIMPSNVKSAAAQTEMDIKDWHAYNLSEAHIKAALEFYDMHAGSSFQDHVMFARSRMGQFCSRCSHCRAIENRENEERYKRLMKERGRKTKCCSGKHEIPFCDCHLQSESDSI